MTREDLIAHTSKALYVTDMMGFGFNAVTEISAEAHRAFGLKTAKSRFQFQKSPSRSTSTRF